jgi:hypothetical protein
MSPDDFGNVPKVVRFRLFIPEFVQLPVLKFAWLHAYRVSEA